MRQWLQEGEREGGGQEGGGEAVGGLVTCVGGEECDACRQEPIPQCLILNTHHCPVAVAIATIAATTTATAAATNANACLPFPPACRRDASCESAAAGAPWSVDAPSAGAPGSKDGRGGHAG